MLCIYMYTLRIYKRMRIYIQVVAVTCDVIDYIAAQHRHSVMCGPKVGPICICLIYT